MKKNTKRIGIVGAGVLALAGTGVAYAAFTSSGSFSASGSVAKAPQALTASATGSGIEELYPGRCSDVTVSFHNPNDHNASVDMLALASGSVSATLDGAPSNLLVFNPHIGDAGVTQGMANPFTFTVPAGGDAAFTVPNLLCLSDKATNDVAGKTAAVSGTVPFKYAVESEYKAS